MKIWATNSAYASGSVGVRPAKTAFEGFDANVPAPCTATDPVFVFSHAKDPTLYNLFYVPDMGRRFYNVVSVVYREGGMYEYHCHVNLLLSMVRAWKTHKANNTPTPTLLEHTNVPTYLTGYDVSETYDAKLYPVKCRSYWLDARGWSNRADDGGTTGAFNISAPHRTSSFFTRHYNDTNRVYILGYMDNSSGYNLVALKWADFNTLINNLTTTSLSGVSDQALAKYYGNPTDCIRMCKVLPCRWQDMQDLASAQGLNAVTSIKLGYYTVSGLSGVYNIPTQNPEMLMTFNQFCYYPRHPQTSTISDKVIHRAPHMETFLSFPPFGTVEIDTTGLGYYPIDTSKPYDTRLTETLDLCTGEATLYITMYHGETAPTDYSWTATERPVMIAKANVCMDVPIIALVQNVGSIRSAQLGLSQLDTKRNMPDAVINRFIVSTISDAFTAFVNNGGVNTVANGIANVQNTTRSAQRGINGFLQDTFGDAPTLGGIPLWSNPNSGKYDVKTTAADVSAPLKNIANQANKTLAAMDTAFSFSNETAQYKTQLSDALHFPQVSITGNSSGSLTYMSSVWGRVDLYITYDEFVVSGFTTYDMGHECYKNVPHIINLSNGAYPYPVNRISLISSNVYVRGADEGQLTDPEKTELRAILQSGFVFFDNNDDWTVI